jgi:uncharacterized protein (TIGR02246 family)
LLACAGEAKVPSNPSADEASIRALAVSFDDAWRKRDPHARAALFADDGSLINPFGMAAQGRAEIEKVFGAETETIANGTTHRFGALRFRFLDADNALVDADNEIDGVRTSDGKDAPTMKYHLVAVATRKDGAWKWLAGRPYAFLPLTGARP